ncbi:choline-sulfatase [Lutibacter oricola]|uniref:Choline-sulfatase n=1 Tax=Lutibacter oricola TaxID=762486 RepID=A0A1H2SJG1_9FLAO|nr:sulfatase [Lutibacter oricola]SDW31843.1 choline-sulfatase [Lutibacter oricola]
MKSYILIFFTVFISFFSNAQDEKKSNVLFIIADDLNTALSGYGHPQCKTPQLDKLAERSVVFKNMHCQHPLCGPSRASIMSGLYTYSTGVLKNSGINRKQKPNIVTLSQAFKNDGYYVARVSKIFHMGIPYDILQGTSGADDPKSWDETYNFKALEHNAKGQLTNWSPKHDGHQKFNGLIAEGDDSDHVDGMAADKAIEMLHKLKNRPFFLAVGMIRPHVPLVAPKKYFDLYNRDEMILPVVPKDDLDDLPEIYRNRNTNKKWGVTPEGHKGLLEAYYASISYMDAQVGRILDTLEKLDLDRNTIVVFCSDHGYLLGEHHKFQKPHLFEEAIRVPFMIHVPWMKSQRGKSTHKITELIDLYPTLTELTEVNAPKELQGKSLVPLLRNTKSKKWKKDIAFTTCNAGGATIRTDNWRFTHWKHGDGGFEMYDLKSDPGEFKNLAENPKYAEIKKRLNKLLLQKKKEAGYTIEMYDWGYK